MRADGRAMLLGLVAGIVVTLAVIVVGCVVMAEREMRGK